ncbi:MAG TPA: hypothetical protein VHH12_05335 [Mycobacterium sp.]|nr:hypothetical protein [Mycobacterium sp.]
MRRGEQAGAQRGGGVTGCTEHLGEPAGVALGRDRRKLRQK